MKPKLIPFQVPWAVSSTTPFMKLTVAEYKYRRLRFGVDLQTPTGKPYFGTVSVRFTKALWFRVNPSFREGTVLDEDAYDWSEVEFHNNLGELGITAWLEKYLDRWRATGICPYPGAYEVKNSDWLPILPLPEPNYMHLTFAGEEMSVEVVTKDWSWESKGNPDLAG